MAVQALPRFRSPARPAAWERAWEWARAHPRRIDAAIALLIAAATFVLYNATLAPSLSYVSPDGNELATIPYTLGLAHPTGYPLYTWLGKAFTFLPVGDVAHRVNLLSAVGAAGACALLHQVVRELRGDRLAALLATAAFATSTTLWSQSTISEVYAPNVFFVALQVLLLLKWGRLQRDPVVRRHGSVRSTVLFGAWALTWALSLGMHLSGLAFAGGFGLYILVVNWRVMRQPLVLLPALALFVLGLMQFWWIPVRSAMGEASPDPIAPTTLDGFLRYTVNAFPQFKWQYPVEVLPDRFILYSRYVRENFGWTGIGLGSLGAAALAILRPRTFLMLALMWATHVVFFMEYRAMDLDVFFIPAHFVLAIAIGFGIACVLTAARTGAARWGMAPVATAAATLLLGWLMLGGVRDTYAHNDQSDHTEINDFYKNVYAMLPEGAVLQGSAGVGGFDTAYYQMVYGARPDVTVLAATNFRPASATTGRSMFSVTGPGGFGRRPGQQGLPGAAGGSWSIPLLVTPAHDDRVPVFGRRDLTLYALSNTPPNLTTEATPTFALNAAGTGAMLVGADLSALTVERGKTVHVRLYWQVTGPSSVSLGLGGGDAPRATHQVGFGLLERYSREVETIQGKTIVEEFDLVILSSTPTGEQPFTARIGASEAPVTIATLIVE